MHLERLAQRERKRFDRVGLLRIGHQDADVLLTLGDRDQVELLEELD